MEYKLGEKYKSYALWDVDKVGNYDIFEVTMHDGEWVFFNHSDKCNYDLNFLGSAELIKL